MKAPSWRVRPDSALRSLLFWGVTLGALLSDLGTKWWAHGHLPSGTQSGFRVVSNTGLFYGVQVPGIRPAAHILLGVAAMAGVLWIVSRTPRRARAYVMAFALVVGGGSGNVGEMAWRGAATDFISFGFGVFNFADVWAFTGAIVYLWIRFRDGVREEGWTWTTLRSKRPLSEIALPPSLVEPGTNQGARPDLLGT